VKLLIDKLPDVLETKQKDNKIRSLLTAMRKDGLINPSPTSKNRRMTDEAGEFTANPELMRAWFD
jgi:ATP-dependent DNA helicase RecG